jgi:hypothetical protein
MTDEARIIEKAMGLVYDKAREVYSDSIVDYGTNPKNYGIMDDPDGPAAIPGT